MSNGKSQVLAPWELEAHHMSDYLFPLPIQEDVVKSMKDAQGNFILDPPTHDPSQEE
jgi:hypothetical protein